MDNRKLEYGLDDIPTFSELMLLGMQWLAIIIPIVIIVGKIVAGLHFTAPAAQTIYIQKIFFITGLALLAQLLWGHRLPLITGPATILLVGIVSSQGSGINAVYLSLIHIYRFYRRCPGRKFFFSGNFPQGCVQLDSSHYYREHLSYSVRSPEEIVVVLMFSSGKNIGSFEILSAFSVLRLGIPLASQPLML